MELGVSWSWPNALNGLGAYGCFLPGEESRLRGTAEADDGIRPNLLCSLCRCRWTRMRSAEAQAVAFMVESPVNLTKALFGPQARMSPKRGWAEITRQGRPESTVPVRMDATVSSPLGEPSQPLQGHADQPAGPMTERTGRLERKESDIVVAAPLRSAPVVWPGRGRPRVGPPDKWPM
ncbi:hypothetical protein ColTof3_07947 [Colletotrichum tofieldiae]|nr:hypothetical protein ColTof3_07947 [Colletotrichum tofieldiae]